MNPAPDRELEPMIVNMERTSKKEKSFDLTLPAVVTGMDATGHKFEEKTRLAAISSQEVCFHLGTRLLIGSKILLSLDVPRTIILEKPLRLSLSGDVVSVRSEDERAKVQFILARLDRAYKLTSAS
jgi:hypothetical protein